MPAGPKDISVPARRYWRSLEGERGKVTERERKSEPASTRPVHTVAALFGGSSLLRTNGSAPFPYGPLLPTTLRQSIAYSPLRCIHSFSLSPLSLFLHSLCIRASTPALALPARERTQRCFTALCAVASAHLRIGASVTRQRSFSVWHAPSCGLVVLSSVSV